MTVIQTQRKLDQLSRKRKSKLNEFLKEFMDDLSAKVFRTYNASVTLQKELEGKEAEI